MRPSQECRRVGGSSENISLVLSYDSLSILWLSSPAVFIGYVNHARGARFTASAFTFLSPISALHHCQAYLICVVVVARCPLTELSSGLSFIEDD